MRKQHLRLAKLLNQFHFHNQGHTDQQVEGFIESWLSMKGDIGKLAEVANVLDFCFQNRHFIKKYPQVVEMLHGSQADAAFITFHALGGVYPLRKPGEARVSIGDHLPTLAQAKADNAADGLAAKGVTVKVITDAPLKEDGSLNDIVILGAGSGRFGRPGFRTRSAQLDRLNAISGGRYKEGIQNLADSLTPGNCSAAKSVTLPDHSEDTAEDIRNKIRAYGLVDTNVLAESLVNDPWLKKKPVGEIREETQRIINEPLCGLPRHHREAEEAVESLKDFDKSEE